MSYFNLTVERNESETAQYLNKLGDLVVVYGVHGVSVIGTIFNIITIIALATRFFDHSFYNFLRCRCVCNLGVCVVGIFFYDNPKQHESVEYLPLVFNWFFATIPMRILFFASAVSDNLIVLNRMDTLHEKRNSIFLTLSKKANLFICFSISITVAVPFYFAIQVVKSSDSPSETKGYWTLTAFAQTPLFKVYALLILLIESVIPLISLIVMNFIALVKFRKLKSEIVNISDETANETINRYTKLVIILTFICIFTRTIDTILGIYNRARVFIGLIQSNEMEALLKLLRDVAYLLIFAEHALDGILYYIFDKTLNSFIRGNSLGS